MVFSSPAIGVTTSGSYPRSELRETNSDGSLYNWNVVDGMATLAVNQVPSTGNVFISQIHETAPAGFPTNL
jgi:hypothetical protein